MTESVVDKKKTKPFIRREKVSGRMEAGFIYSDGTYEKDMEIRDAMDLDAFLEKYDIAALSISNYVEKGGSGHE